VKIIIKAKGSYETAKELLEEIQESFKQRAKVLKFMVKMNLEKSNDYLIFAFDIKMLGFVPAGLVTKQLNELVDVFKQLLEKRGIKYVSHEFK